MKLLVTDPSLGVWEMNDAYQRQLPSPFEWPCMPCASASLLAFCCAQSRECVCLRRSSCDVVSSMPSVPGVSAMCFSPCSRYLYQLSGEADCIHTRSAASGELLYAAPVGVFPRMMALEAAGSRMLAAGGAVNEALILSAPDLQCEKVIHTRHPCFAADFCKEGLVLVCAAEGEDIQTMVYTLAPKAVRPRLIAELPGQPGGLCVCPNGKDALISTRDGLMKVCLSTGQLKWNVPEWALCMRICCFGDMVLVSDTLDGRICQLNHHRPWESRVFVRGTAAQACFLF